VLLATVRSAKVLTSACVLLVLLCAGPGHILTGSPLTFSLLRAEPTAYTAKAGGVASNGAPFALGKGISLVSAMQARNNARLVVAANASPFADQYAREACCVDASSQYIVTMSFVLLYSIAHRPAT